MSHAPPRAYAFRIVVATAVLCAILLGMPFLPTNLGLLCFLIAVVGIFDSVGYVSCMVSSLSPGSTLRFLL